MLPISRTSKIVDEILKTAENSYELIYLEDTGRPESGPDLQSDSFGKFTDLNKLVEIANERTHYDSGEPIESKNIYDIKGKEIIIPHGFVIKGPGAKLKKTI